MDKKWQSYASQFVELWTCYSTAAVWRQVTVCHWVKQCDSHWQHCASLFIRLNFDKPVRAESLNRSGRWKWKTDQFSFLGGGVFIGRFWINGIGELTEFHLIGLYCVLQMRRQTSVFLATFSEQHISIQISKSNLRSTCANWFSN